MKVIDLKVYKSTLKAISESGNEHNIHLFKHGIIIKIIPVKDND